MILFLAPTISSTQISRIQDILQEHGFSGHPTEFDEQSVLVVVDPKSGCSPLDRSIQNTLFDLPGILKIAPIATSYPLVCRQIRTERSCIKTGSLNIGNGHFGIIAGPCTVESEQQVMETAIAVKKAGATGLRGGAFKPRTSPYAFQGLKEKGLQILAKAREETGLTIVTEALTPEEVPLVSEYADVIQIGTRNAQNYRLLETVGRIRKPVLLKRGFSCTLEEFLMSAEYILAGGNQQVILCERGIRTFETYTRFTLPLAIIPELQFKTHLPVVVDPSHATGRGDLVPAMGVAATAAGADGLLVEVHPNPKSALCDGQQSLTFSEFEEMVQLCQAVMPIVQRKIK